jgi:nucleotide-binding universal stress UspA family protein
MFEHILFPVDFSPSCVAMAAYVQRAAQIFGAHVTLVHVCDLASHNGFELYARRPDEIAEDHWNLARNNLDLFLESEFPDSTYPRLLVAGDAAGVIVETARKGKFDLIIMPTHAGRFRRILLGSTTARVLNGADCPVLTTEHSAIGKPRSLEHRNWVCGIGLSGDSERVLRYATNASLAAGAKLSVIHVIQTSKSKIDAETRGPSEEERQARQRIAELQNAIGSDASVRIAFGPVRETLLQEVQQLSGDVLVIGRSLHGAFGRLEDLTYSLVRDSPCPVVSV